MTNLNFYLAFFFSLFINHVSSQTEALKAGVTLNGYYGEASFKYFPRQNISGFSIGLDAVLKNKIGLRYALTYLSTQPYLLEKTEGDTANYEYYKMNNFNFSISPNYNIIYKKTALYFGLNFALGLNKTDHHFYTRWVSRTDPKDYFNNGDRSVNEICVSLQPMLGVRQDLNEHLSLDIGLDFYRFSPIPIPFANTVLYKNPQISTLVHFGFLYNFIK